MISTYGNETTDRAVRSLLQNSLGLTTELNTHIHKNDQMFSFVASVRGSGDIARSEYFTSGAHLLKILEQLIQWKFGSFDNLPALLDFASGYGRLTRYLVQKMSADHIWVSDIQADAVSFQVAEFGVHGFVSTIDPTDLTCNQTFDCIFVASLFSHLPEATFAAWLKKLFSLLKPGGVLAFSVHDESRLSTGLTMPESGIWFAKASEIASSSTSDYGVAIVTEAFVSDAIVQATGRSEYHRIRYGLQYHQDLYLIVNEQVPDFSGLHFTYLPHGTVDHALWRGPGELYLKGWAADFSDADKPLEVQVHVDGHFQQQFSPLIFRPDLREHYKDERFFHAGWECTCHLPQGAPNRLLVVKGVSPAGAESLLYIGTVDALLPQGRVDLCRWSGPGELYVKGWAADLGTSSAPVEVQIFVNDQLRQECLPFVQRPDLREHFQDDRFEYAGWECSFHLPNDDLTQIMMVKSVSASGAEVLLYLGAVASLVPVTSPNAPASVSEVDRQHQEELNRLEGKLQEITANLQLDLDRRLEYVRHLEAEVARKNAALRELEVRMRMRQRAGLRLPRLPWRRANPKENE